MFFFPTLQNSILSGVLKFLGQYLSLYLFLFTFPGTCTFWYQVFVSFIDFWTFSVFHILSFSHCLCSYLVELTGFMSDVLILSSYLLASPSYFPLLCFSGCSLRDFPSPPFYFMNSLSSWKESGSVLSCRQRHAYQRWHAGQLSLLSWGWYKWVCRGGSHDKPLV